MTLYDCSRQEEIPAEWISSIKRVGSHTIDRARIETLDLWYHYLMMTMV